MPFVATAVTAVGGGLGGLIGAAGGAFSGVIGQVAFGLLNMVISSLFGPKIDSVKIAAGQDLQVSPSAEGPIVPIVFGRASVLPNLIRYEQGSVRNVAIKEEVGGGGIFGGGEDVVVGRRDFASWEVGICMGPIDSIEEITLEPSKENLLAAPITFVGSNKVTVNLSSKNGFIRGAVDIYSGADSQIRGSDYYFDKYGVDGEKPALNYRGVAFAVFKGFECGRTTPDGPGVTMPTFKFRIRRLPSLTDLPAGMERQGSYDMESEAYLDCNPAALLWEVLTSDLGPQLSPALLDEASFVRSSQVFAENSQGVSILLEQAPTVKDIHDTLKNSVKILAFWDGWKLVVRSYFDNEAFYDNIRAIDVEDVSELNMSLGTIDEATNEIKVRFTDLESKSKEGIVARQNTALIADQGGRRRMVEIDGRALTSGEAANRLAEIAIQEGYPQTFFTILGNMSLASITPMDVIALKWTLPDYNVVFYCRVAEVSPSRERQTVEISAVGDPILRAEISEVVASSAPSPSWSSIKDLTKTDRSPPDAEDLGILQFVTVACFELPPQLTGRQASGSIPLFQPRQAGVIGAAIYSQVGDAVAKFAGNFYHPARSGKFESPLNFEEVTFVDDPIEVYVEFPEIDGAALVAGGSIIENLVDNDYTELLDSGKSILIAGDEIMIVGKITEAEGVFHFQYIQRGAFGTPVGHHPQGTRWFWFEDKNEIFNSAVTIPEAPGESVKVYSYPIRYGSVGVTANPAYHSHRTNDGIYLAEGLLPMTALLWDITDEGGGNYGLSLVPRLASNGAGLSEIPVTGIGDLSFEVNEHNIGGGKIASYLLNGTFTQGDHTSTTGGLVTKTITPEPTATYLQIFTVSEGLRSNEPLRVDIP